MMMGHGSPYGLLSVGQFEESTNGYIIDDSFVPIIQEKDNSIFIWCHADEFVKKNELKGFYSGMFISEQSEASDYGYSNINFRTIDESNKYFSQILSNVIDTDNRTIFENVKKYYGQLGMHNLIANYNNKRIYIS